MKSLNKWLSRLAGAFNKNANERDLADEFESHFQLHVDDNLRAGRRRGWLARWRGTVRESIAAARIH